MDINPKIILRQDLTGAYFLSVYINNALKIGDIALGTDEKVARQNATRIHQCMKIADAIDDQTTVKA